MNHFSLFSLSLAAPLALGAMAFTGGCQSYSPPLNKGDHPSEHRGLPPEPQPVVAPTPAADNEVHQDVVHPDDNHQ